MVAVCMAFILLVVLILLTVRSVVKVPNDSSSSAADTSSHAANMDTAKQIDDNMGSMDHYWESFKQRNPEEAKEIECLLEDRDLSALPDVDAFQLVNTLVRVSFNATIPISKLKEHANEKLFCFAKEDELAMIIERFRRETDEEAKTFHIKRDNTYSNILLEWAVGWQHQLMEERMLRHMSTTLGIDLEVFREEARKRKAELNLPPDISQFNRIENRLFKVAKRGVERMNNTYRQLSDEGEKEVLIYCTTCLIDLPTNYGNTLDLNVTEDRYFLLLADAVMPDELEFINSRIRFYNEEKSRIRSYHEEKSRSYVPVSIFNAFYLNPLCEDPTTSLTGAPEVVELMKFSAALNELEHFLDQERKESV